jgi:Spy/CpxP family protein refolding chaperone
MTKKWFFRLILASAAMGIAYAQGPSVTTYQWWNTPIVNTLGLSETQLKQIHSVVNEHRDNLKLLYSSVNKAESDLQEVFNQDQLDQSKGHQAVNQLASARGDLTRELADMSLELRTILTSQQWQDLQSRPVGRGPSRGRGRRGAGQAPSGSGPHGPPPSGSK